VSYSYFLLSIQVLAGCRESSAKRLCLRFPEAKHNRILEQRQVIESGAVAIPAKPTPSDRFRRPAFEKLLQTFKELL
jgi:hypothetical protein